MVTVAGIDLGTQSIKVLVYCSASKEIVSVVSSPLTVDQDAFGKAEQTTNAWLDALHLCFDKIPADIKKTIACIGVSGQQHGLVALDEQNQSVYPVKLWCDTTTSSQAEQLTALLGGKESCLSEIGNEFVSGFTAPKVLWLKQNHPDLYHKMRCILLPHDYLNFYLTGEKTTEFGDASGTGMLNIFTRSWSSLALSAIDAERDLMPCLPRLIDYVDAAGFLQPSTADALGLQAGIPVSAGGGDNMMAAIGTGNVGAVDDSAQAQSSNVVTVSLGSSGTVYAHSSKPVVDSQGRLAAFCSSTGGWLPLLCTMNCTLSSELVRGFLNVDLTELEAALNRSPVGSEGILCLPFFNGERTPNLPHAKASYLGISGENFSHDKFLRSTIVSQRSQLPLV